MFPCPRCGVENLARSHARGLERLLKTLSSYRLYRCADCLWRGWLPTGESPWPGILKRCARAMLLFTLVILSALTAWLITRFFS